MAKVWLKLLGLLEKSIMVQAFLTAGFGGVYLYLVATGKQVPEGFQNLMFTILAFWMGSKVQHEIDKRTINKGE